MNYRLLSRVFGILLILLSVGMGVCLAFAWWERAREAESDAVHALGLSAAITLSTGMVLFLAGKSRGQGLLRKEAVVVVGLGWFVSALFGMIPYLACEPRLPPADAFFESVSGFTTTGSTTIVDLEIYPRSILLWRSLTQWLGGVGILVLFVALLSFLGAGGKSLFRVESSAQVGEGTSARIRQTAMRLWTIYLGLSGITVAGLLLCGLSPFDAICHTMTTVSTGGFSTYNASIGHFGHPALEWFVIVMMLASAIPFFFYIALVQRRWNRVRAEEEALFFVILTAGAIVLVILNLKVGRDFDYSWAEAVRAAAFQVSAIVTTTGFATADYNVWPGFSVAVLLFLMFAGGCTGSTAGGIKMARLLLFVKLARQEVVAAFRPRRVFRIELNRTPAEGAATAAVFLIALFATVGALGTLVIALLEPALDFDTCLSAATATLFNIGPGLGAVGPTENFAHFNPPAKLVMSLLMVMGRLELFAVLALFSTALWRKY